MALARGGLAGSGRVYLLALPTVAIALAGARSGVAAALLSLLVYGGGAVAAGQGWLPAWLVHPEGFLPLSVLNEERLLLEISDDGCGFEVPERWILFARQGRLGLLGAAERAESTGGQMEVESVPGKGTVVRVVAPRRRAPATPPPSSTH